MKNRFTYVIIILLLVTIPVVLYFYLTKNGPFKPAVPPPTTQTSNAPIQLNQEKEQLLESLVKNRKPLVEVDQKAKDALIQQPNPLLETPEYVVVYDQKDDMFQVEIRTIKISTVQSEVVQWFKSKGFSGAAVCTLPIQFSIDKQDAESLRGSGTVFNPLPPGC